jgi:hypothetical protein
LTLTNNFSSESYKTTGMKKMAIIFTAAIASGLAIYALRRRLKYEVMRDRVANEGYETALDILFPRNHNFFKKLQYGPVLPGE